MKKRDPLIDILKGLAVLAVVLIHFNGKVFSYLSPGQKNWLLFFDQTLRFSVPLFVALSGYSLSKRYGSEKINPLAFLKRRIFKITPAYLFWSAVAYIFIIFFQAWPGYHESYPWWQIIFLGKADYHLYFVPMIFQLYLLFPLLLKSVKKNGSKFVTIVFLLQFAWFWYADQQIKFTGGKFWKDQWQYLLFFNWIGYFVLGIFLAFQKESQKKFLEVLGLIALVFGLKLSTSTSWQFFDEGKNYIQITRFNRPEIFIYASGATVFLIRFGQKLLSLPTALLRPFEKLGQHSYGVYLAHTLPLRFAGDIMKISPLYHPEIQISFTLGVSLIFAWFYKRATKIYKLAKATK